MWIDDYQKVAAKTAIYPREEAFNYLALKLAGEAGEVAQSIGKMIRDDRGLMTETRKGALLLELGDVLWYVAMLAKELGVSLDSVAEANLEKLEARAKRGALHGSGDNR